MTPTNAPAGCRDGVLSERYRLTERIAVGGMGEVWAATDEVLGREVAVKFLRPEYVDDAEFRERFRAEARHAAGLSHPGIASVFDYGEQVEPEPSAWLVMELVEGEPLSALLQRTPVLLPARALDIVGQAALALEAAHSAGVVHRDVKPGNLLVRPDGVVKVTDFGIARAVDAVPITRTGTMVGTAYYLSPEQAGGKPVTPASDVYSLGVVAYECLAGQRPFPGDNAIAVATAHLREDPPPLPDTVPADVRALVAEAMQKDPARRPEHAGELGRAALALRRTLLGEPETQPGPAGSPEPATRVLTQVAPALPPTAASGTAAPSLMPSRPASSRRPVGQDHRRAVRLTSAALLVLALLLAARGCGGGAGSGGTPVVTPTPSPTPAPSPRVTVAAARYVGKGPDTVTAALVQLGLRPRLAYDGRTGRAGSVSSVTPTGSLAPGSVVTVHVVPVPAAPADKPDKGKKKGKDD